MTPGGDVQYTESSKSVGWAESSRPTEERGGPRSSAHPTKTTKATASFHGWVVGQDQFAPGLVGGKSNNLNGLRGRLPDWIRLPKSIALPFGVFDRVLADAANRRLREECKTLIAAAETKGTEALAELRAKLHGLTAPTELPAALREGWQRAGLPPVPWEQTWHAIRRVWASKWNDRAYLSRRARGVPHDSLQMAVLIQQVVPADYAFVIHTVNPLTGNHGEIFAEVVLGMGETLVGNYPGRALGFVCRKTDLKPEILSYPGKSVGLYGKGVIFRSDSNGEDLEGFAGAGLYDSFLAEEPEHRAARLPQREAGLGRERSATTCSARSLGPGWKSNVCSARPRTSKERSPAASCTSSRPVRKWDWTTTLSPRKRLAATRSGARRAPRSAARRG